MTSLFPNFSSRINDYVVRCNDEPVTVAVHTSGAWSAAIGDRLFRSGNFTRTVPLSAGRAFTVTTKRRRNAHRDRYHVRCLPNDFPTYSFTRRGPVSPRFFSVDEGYFFPFSPSPSRRYPIIFDNHGVPIWWYHAEAIGPRVLPNGHILWFDFAPAKHQIRRLDGTLVSTLDSVGNLENLHDLQFAGRGDYLVGSSVPRSHVDASAYGGSSDATVKDTELQQVNPGGGLVWDWKSQDHISLAETGRWWRRLVNSIAPGRYDILHWNSIEPAGNSVIASFRHLDAVYKIEKSTGSIVWKLGGTTTPKSLEVKDNPRSYPLGGQHDARLLSDGTLTLFNDRTFLSNERPRAERYRINEEKGTATLVQSITDPAVSSTECCGSARLLSNGDWLISWGGYQNNPIGGYRPDGERTFLLRFDSSSSFSYRAEPVPATVSARDLRAGMRAMFSHSARGSSQSAFG